MSFYLIWSARSFGEAMVRAGHTEVRAAYDSLEEAKAQGDWDHRSNEDSPDREPLRVEDEDGNTLFTWD